ncbi:MAG: NADH-quinone oxidoreductase subunit C [Planctomycetes bacterium]|nr:NADH-quinone oxidoreductase subunit C [Planctomycetota bacterium]
MASDPKPTTPEPKGAAAVPRHWLPSPWDHSLEKLKATLSSPGGPCDANDLKIVPWGAKQCEGYIDVPAAKIADICKVLRDDPDCRYEIVMCISGVDYSKEDDKLAIIYHLLSVANNQRAQIRAWVPKAAPEIDTVEGVWAAANWHERETYDFFGVVFRGHSDLRRILCPEDWVGFPLLKDYEFPKEYHGISCV